MLTGQPLYRLVTPYNEDHRATCGSLPASMHKALPSRLRRAGERCVCKANCTQLGKLRGPAHLMDQSEWHKAAKHVCFVLPRAQCAALHWQVQNADTIATPNHDITRTWHSLPVQCTEQQPVPHIFPRACELTPRGQETVERQTPHFTVALSCL